MQATAEKKRHDTKNGRFYEVEGRLLPSVTSILQVIGKPALVNWASKTEREMVSQAAADLYEDLPERAPKMQRMAYLATLDKRIGSTKAHQKELAKAGEIGSQIHGLVEWNLRKELGQAVGLEPTVKDKALWGFMVYEEWRKQVNFRPRYIEQQVWSLKHGYAGTMDWLAMLELRGDLAKQHGMEGDFLTVGDWKSGKAIYAEYLLQVAAYVMALIEMGHATPPVNACIVRLPKVDSDPEPEMKIVPWAEIPWLFARFLDVMGLHAFQKHMDSKEPIPREEIAVVKTEEVAPTQPEDPAPSEVPTTQACISPMLGKEAFEAWLLGAQVRDAEAVKQVHELFYFSSLTYETVSRKPENVSAFILSVEDQIKRNARIPAEQGGSHGRRKKR